MTIQPNLANDHNSTAVALTFSGALGIVIIPDQATIAESYKLARNTLPAGSEYILSPGAIPHITLYHGKFLDVPTSEAQTILRDIRSDLQRANFSLGPIQCFGGNFIFLNVEPDDTTRHQLQLAHEKSLLLSRFLDRTAPPKATSEEGLSLSTAELENLEGYGHPLVRQSYLPHITLGFHRGLAVHFPNGQSKKWRSAVGSVEFVRVGYPGTIEEIVSLESAV